MRKCRTIPLEKLTNNIVSTIGAILAPDEEDKRAERSGLSGFIEITIEHNRNGTCRVWTPARGSDSLFAQKPVPIKFSKENFSDIMTYSRTLETLVKVQESDWLASYKSIGEKIKTEVRNNADFLLAVDRVSREAGQENGVRNIHVMFVADQIIDRIPFESLVDWDGDNFLLLKAPVYRRMHADRSRITRGRLPLFSNSAGSQHDVNVADFLLAVDRVSREAGQENGVRNIHVMFVADQIIDRIPKIVCISPFRCHWMENKQMTSILIVDPDVNQRELIDNLITDEHDNISITTRRHLKGAMNRFSVYSGDWNMPW